MDKTPQIAEEQLVITMDKAQETKLQRYKSYRFGVCYADISKCEEMSKWTSISLQVATKMFFKNHHNFLSEGLSKRYFQQWVQQEAKRSILQDYEVPHRHTQTECYNPRWV